MWLGLSVLDWVIIAAALLGIAAVGVAMSRQIHDRTDFFMGGRRFGKVFMMFFAFASGTSGDDAVSSTAGTWRAGLAGIWWTFLWLWATPFYWIMAPIMRRLRALTTSDFFEARYDTSTATLYAFYGILMTIAMMAGGLYGSGKLVNALTGGELNQVAKQLDVRVAEVEWNTTESSIEVKSRQLQGNELAVLAMTILFVAYGMAGGLGAAIVTDFVQGILTIVFSFLLLPWIFFEIGGLAGLRERGEIREGMFDLFGREDVAGILGTEPITVFYVVMLALTGIIGVVAQPQVMSMCGAGKTEMEARLGFTYGHLMKRFCTIAWTFIGLGCIVWYLSADISPLSQETRERLTPDLVATDTKAAYDPDFDREFGDELFGRVARDLLPSGLLGLILVASLAATMSTADTRMLASSALFTQSIYRRFLKPDRSEHHYLRVGRIASLVIVLFSLVLQTTFTDVIDALKFVLKTTAPIGISFWIGIAWRGWTPKAVWASSLAAYSTWALCAFFPQWLSAMGVGEPIVIPTADHIKVADAWMMLGYLSTGLLVGVVVSLVTSRPPKEQLDAFFLLMRTPVLPDEHIAAPCTLPDNPAPPLEKMIDHPDIEIPKPTRIDITGFILAWVFVGIIVWIPYWLSRG